jgi:hypothetical protein
MHKKLSINFFKSPNNRPPKMNFTGSILEIPDVACPVDLHYLSPNQPSLCIPRVHKKIGETIIRSVLNNSNLGSISQIEIIETQFGKKVFVHFDKWFWSQDAQNARRALITGNEIKIIYNNPWFWNVSAKRLTHAPRLSSSAGPVATMVCNHDHKESKRSLVVSNQPFPFETQPFTKGVHGRPVTQAVTPRTPVTPRTKPPTSRVANPEPTREDQGIDIDYSDVPPSPPKFVRQYAVYTNKNKVDNDPLYNDL